MEFYRFDEPALNTFSLPIAERRQQEHGYRLVEKVRVPVDRLDSILAGHLQTTQKIDFLTVDAEGLDLDVLRSNDWERFRPAMVVAECLDLHLLDMAKDPVVELMASVRYDLVAKAANSVFFMDRG